MAMCVKCGEELEADARFCKICGTAAMQQVEDLESEDLPTWNLPQPTAPQPDQPRPTNALPPNPSTGQGLSTGPSYLPPENDYSGQPPAEQPQPYLFQRPTGSPPPGYQQPPFYQQQDSYQPHPGYMQPASSQPMPPTGKISLGDWLSGGWRVYSENWFLMSMATMITGLLSLFSIGILAGPLMMGLFRMAFKTIKGERPVIGDLFNWDGRFLQAFLAGLISFFVFGGISSIGRGGAMSSLVNLVISPIMTIMLSLTLPMILDRKSDIAETINHVWKRVFAKEALMWWIVGLVFFWISVGGFFACGIGGLVTIPWIVSSASLAYRDTFGIDDPNRTLS